MSEVKLFKKTGTYVDKKDGKDKPFTNFYVRCGDSLIPVQVCFFENDEGKDPQYSARRAVLSAFAETLPDKPVQPDKADKDKNSVRSAAKSNLKPMNDEDNKIPF